MQEKRIPLIVDLDSTLIKTDSLHETLVQYIKYNIINIFSLIKWYFHGKSYFKFKLSENIILKPDLFDYREEVLNLIKYEKEKGNKIYLCSGASARQVKLVFEYLEIFDDYFASTNDINLTREYKASLLTKKFGKKNYNYVGDSLDDLNSWENSEKVYTVNINSKIKQKLNKKNLNPIEVVKSQTIFSSLKEVIRTLRIYQWSKNLLIFLPIFLSQEFTINNFAFATIGFVCFSLLASFTYIVNDIFDLHNDRRHHKKRYRAIASGKINILNALKISLIFLLISFSLAIFFLNYHFVNVMLLYLLFTIAYTLYLKNIWLLDIIVLSVFYVIRILSGGIINNIDISLWLISFSTFFFLFLATIKRLGELINYSDREDSIKGRSYNIRQLKTLKLLLLIFSISSITLLSFYLLSEKVHTLYNNIYILFFVCPVMLYWQFHIYKKTIKKSMLDDPIVFITKDTLSWVIAIFSISIIISQMKIW